jgi:hypothetical protein
MNIIVLPQAADEFEDAVGHYDDKQPGLGQRFRDEVDFPFPLLVCHACYAFMGVPARLPINTSIYGGVWLLRGRAPTLLRVSRKVLRAKSTVFTGL